MMRQHYHRQLVSSTVVDPYGTGGHVRQYVDRGNYHECPLNI